MIFFNFIYRSIIQRVFHQRSFSVCNVIFFIIFFSLKLPVQLVLITTDVVSSNPGHGEGYLIQHYVITFVNDLRQVYCLLRFPQTNQIYRHDIAEILFESGVKHHNHRNKISEYFPLNFIIPLYHLFTCGNTISDNPAAAPLPPFTYMPLRLGVLDTALCNKVCQWLAAGSWFSSGTPVSSSNKSDIHDINEILLKVAFNTHNLNPCLFDIPG
jgi:hypothetical protein